MILHQAQQTKLIKGKEQLDEDKNGGQLLEIGRGAQASDRPAEE
jgi:hypothetical protein